jgi:hypothetical protein
MARSSPYASTLNLLSPNALPSWVYGDDYGSLTRTLAARDVAAMQPMIQTQTFEDNRLALEEKQRKDDYERSVAEMIGSQAEAPRLGDMYGMMADQAAKFGMVDEYAKIQSKITDLEEQARKNKLATYDDIADAYRLGNALGDPELARQRLQAAGVDYQIPDSTLKDMIKKEKGSGSVARQRNVYIAKDGKQRLIPESDFNTYAEDGWVKAGGAAVDPLLSMFGVNDSGGEAVEAATSKQEKVVDDLAAKYGVTVPPGHKLVERNGQPLLVKLRDR